MKSANLCQRLCSLGVPKEQRNLIISDVQRWVRCSGPEWTVERLKALKQEFVTTLAGKPVKAPNVRHNRDGFPSGVWSWIFRTSRLTNEQKLNVLMAYSGLSSRVMTEKQRKKFFGSMESPDQTGLNSRFSWVTVVKTTCQPWIKKDRADQYSPWERAGRPFYVDMQRPSTNSPTLTGRSAACNDPMTHFASWVVTYPAQMALMKRRNAFVGQIPRNIVPQIQPRDCRENDLLSRTIWQCAGKIAAIQEPGYKLRGIASPFAIWQSILDPMTQVLLRDLQENHPSDCTHDQDAGVLCIQRWLEEGRTCFSVDMSDATNLFPLPLQLDILRKRFAFDDEWEQRWWKDSVDLFEDLAKAPWFFKEPDGSVSLHRFTRGQPLGLRPSFACFALAHNTLLEGICQKYKKDNRDTFRILGDDIVICDPIVHRVYREVLKNLGCKVSESKTLVSNRAAEVAGCVITPTEVLRGYKWRGVNDSNFIAIAQHYGIRSMSMMSRQQRAIVKHLAPIPEYLGGFGWNPAGTPLQERLQTPLAQGLLAAREADPKINLTGLMALESMDQSFCNDWNQLLSDTERNSALTRLLRFGLAPSWSQYSPTSSQASVPHFQNFLVRRARQQRPLHLLRDEVIFAVADTQEYTMLQAMYGPLCVRTSKTEFSPSRKSAYDLVEATYKMEALGVEAKVWKNLRSSAERVLKRRRASHPSPPLWKRQEVSAQRVVGKGPKIH